MHNNHLREAAHLTMLMRYLWKGSGSTSPAEQQCQRFSLAEIKSATQNFKEELVVGKGGFGKVYKAFIKNREEAVAVKRLISGSKQGDNEFWMEIKTLSRLRHLHLVSLLGYCNQGNERILIYEYMPGGSLVDHLYKLKGSDHPPLSWEKRLKICIGAARGLDYLHTGTAPGVIHRDVKDSNILLDDKFVAKIADFGLAKLESIDQLQSHVSTNVKGTFGYMAPELFWTNSVSKKSDVYALGVVLLVVLSGRPAVDMKLKEDEQSLLSYAQKCMEEGRVDKIIDPCLKLETQSNSLEEFIKIVEKCLLKQPKARPSMAHVVANLELALENQQGALSSTSQKVECNWTAQIVDPISDDRDINSGSDYSGTKIPTRLTSLSPAPPQNVVYREESSKISQCPEESIRIFSFSELNVATKNFRYNLKIGEDDTGKCYKGWLAEPIGSDSLVLVRRHPPIGFRLLEYFQDKMDKLKRFSHPNLLNLIGYCCSNGEFLLVQEFMNSTILEEHLFFRRDSGVQTLSWGLRLKICSDVARGLAFIHSLEEPIIYKYMEASKILLDESYNAKVCGSGMVRFDTTALDTFNYSIRRGLQSMGYAAPEWVLTGHSSVESDVYSFGVILVEILTGLRAYDVQRPTEQRKLIDWTKFSLSHKRNLTSIMDHGLKGQYSVGVALQVAQLALNCLSALPKTRPSMREVLQTLEHIQSTN